MKWSWCNTPSKKKPSVGSVKMCFSAGTSPNLQIFEKDAFTKIRIFFNFIKHGITLTGNVQFWKFKISIIAKCMYKLKLCTIWQLYLCVTIEKKIVAQYRSFLDTLYKVWDLLCISVVTCSGIICGRSGCNGLPVFCVMKWNKQKKTYKCCRRVFAA